MPSALCALRSTFAAFHDGRSAPSSPMRYGAHSPSCAPRRSQAATSVGETAAMLARVASASVCTPTLVPSGNNEQKGLLEGTSSKPWRARSAPIAALTGPPANRPRFIANRSWRKPGKVTSAVRTAPPAVSALSSTMTRRPFFASRAAAESPLIPDPMTMMSAWDSMTHFLLGHYCENVTIDIFATYARQGNQPRSFHGRA